MINTLDALSEIVYFLKLEHCNFHVIVPDSVPRMEIKNRYTSVACNRTPEALDWGHDGLIYYAACHAIAIFDPNVGVPCIESFTKYQYLPSLFYNNFSFMVHPKLFER